MTDTNATPGICVGSDRGKTHRADVTTVGKLRYAIFRCTGRAVPLFRLFVTGSGDIDCKACLKKENR